MPRYIAFLRGINVGGRRVKMDRLRELFREMDFDDVSSFIASGNVHFGAGPGNPDAVRRRIEEGLAEALGYEVDTFLRTPRRLEEIVAGAEEARSPPVGAPEEASTTGDGGKASGPSHYVLFLHGPAPAALRSGLAPLESDTDRFTFEGDEVHWWTGGRLSESPLFGGTLDRVLKPFSNTMRNVTTLRRILAKVSAGAPRGR